MNDLKANVILLFSLLFTASIYFIPNGNTSKTDSSSASSPTVHQGNLIINGNQNFTIIDEVFVLNGSIILEENATLFVKNAIINFTQTKNNQFNVTLRNPLHGKPRLCIENATILTSGLYLDVSFYENSSMLARDLTSYATIKLYDSSVAELSRSIIYRTNFQDAPSLTALNSSIEYVDISHSSVNCSITNIKPYLSDYWNSLIDFSVAVLPNGKAPNITLANTYVLNWILKFYGKSSVSINKSELKQVWAYGNSVINISDSKIVGDLNAKYKSILNLYDSSIKRLNAYSNSSISLINTTYNSITLENEAKVYILWHLDIHVVDLTSQDIPSANVTIYYQNNTIASSKATDSKGLANFTLYEKMMNSTGNYYYGNYTIKTTYGTYSNQTTTNMTENKQITVTMPMILSESPPNFIMPLIIAITLLAALFAGKYARQKKQAPATIAKS